MLCPNNTELYENIIRSNILSVAYYNHDWYLASICYWLLKEYNNSYIILFSDVISEQEMIENNVYIYTYILLIVSKIQYCTRNNRFIQIRSKY